MLEKLYVLDESLQESSTNAENMCNDILKYKLALDEEDYLLRIETFIKNFDLINASKINGKLIDKLRNRIKD